MVLTAERQERYERNLLVEGFGEAGQERLAAARVAVVGLGGLGSPVALYLAAAGVGRLGLIDPDRVELSNLQRQVLHATSDVGMPKTESAGAAIHVLNPEVQTETIADRVTPANAADLVSPYDLVVEATDDLETKFLINDVCLELRKPFATAGILALSGQAQFVVPGQSPCLRCAVVEIPQGVPTTSERGVLGAVPGILGSVQALEVIRYLAGLWAPLPGGAGYLHSVDGDTMRLRSLRLAPRAGCRCAQLWDEER